MTITETIASSAPATVHQLGAGRSGHPAGLLIILVVVVVIVVIVLVVRSRRKRRNEQDE